MEEQNIVSKVAEALKELVGKQCSTNYQENRRMISAVVFPASEGVLKTSCYSLTDWYVANHSSLIYESKDGSYSLNVKYSKKLKDDPNLLARDPNRYVFKSFRVCHYDETEKKWIEINIK